MGNTEGTLPSTEASGSILTPNMHPQDGRALLADPRRFLEASRKAAERRNLEASASIRGEIMAIRADRAWCKTATSNSDELEIVDLRVGNRSNNTSPTTKDKRYSQQIGYLTPVTEGNERRSRSPEEQNGGRSRLKFGIDSILHGDSDNERTDTVKGQQEQPKNLSTKRRMESSSDYSSDDCPPSDEHEANTNASRQEERTTPPHKLPRFERKINPSPPPKTLKFHQYHTKRSISRDISDPSGLKHGIAPSPRARGKSESPRSASSLFERPSTSSSFVEVRSPNFIRGTPLHPQLSPSFHRQTEFHTPKFHFSGGKPSHSDRQHSTVSPTFVPSRVRSKEDMLSPTFRSVSDSDDVFRDNADSLAKLARHLSPPNLAKDHHQPRSSWRAFETSSPMSPRSDVFQSLGQQRERFSHNFPLFPNRTTSLSSSPASPGSPPLPSGLSLQTWQAIAANCHPSLRHLVYPYAYGGNAAAAAMALAAVRQLKTIAPGMGEMQTSPQPGQSTSPTFDEKRKVPKKRRKWSRAVFSLMQRRGLEKSFQVQKYVAKPERKGLAEALGLTDAQVKIWFQNRRMKWRQELKNSEKQSGAETENIKPPTSEPEHGQLVAQSC